MNFKFWRRPKREEELGQEIQPPLRTAARERMGNAESRSEAESSSRQEFGNPALAKDATREVGGPGWSERLAQDFRYGFRMLRKSPLYASIGILTLALGIGASTAIFSVVYGVLLRSLPYYKPEQIVRVWEVNSKHHNTRFSDPNFEDMRAQADSFQGMAEISSDEAPVYYAGGGPDRVRVAHVSSDFFSVMGVQPVLGRLFGPEEQRFGAAPTALVSYAFWRSRLHGEQNLQTLKFMVSKNPIAIVGVLPPGFSFPEDSQVWMPREIDVRLPSRSAHNWQVVARIRDGFSLAKARADLSAVAGRLYQQYRSSDMTMVDAAILPLRDALTADIKPALLVLMSVAGLLLLVACANVMNLSLAQASARSGELAIRAALGASRGRLVQQFMGEALLLSFVSGLLGIVFAYFGVHGLVAMAPSDIPRLNEIEVNLPVLWFALGICVALAAGLGILTALQATSGDVQSTLVEAGRRQCVASRKQFAGRIIVAGQVAITLALLVGAALLGRSMLRALSVHPGFETEHVFAMELKLPPVEPQTESQRVNFLGQLISRLQAVPGIQAVGGTDALPLKSSPADGNFVVMNPQQLLPEQRDLIARSAHTYLDNADPAFLNDFSRFLDKIDENRAQMGDADYVVASEGYFQVLGIPLLRGRLFNNADNADAPQVAVISESVARQKWPDQDPIGQSIEFGNMDGDLRLLKIVGIVGEVRMRSLESAPRPTIYANYRQRPRTSSEFNIVLRTNSGPAAVFNTARRVLAQLDPTVAPRFNTFNEIFSGSLSSRSFNLLLVGVFALTALTLAMAGVFGVLAYSVAQRTREIGVRMALGATRITVLKMILGQGLLTTAIGTAIGLLGAFLLTRAMSSLLFEVSPTDPLTLVGVPLLVVLVAMLASYIPARRATRTDPMVALRQE